MRMAACSGGSWASLASRFPIPGHGLQPVSNASPVRTQYHIINYLQHYRSRAIVLRDTWAQTCPGPSPTRIHRGFAAFLLPLLFTRSCHQLLAFVSPCFQPLAHSFIFWITAIPGPSHSLRTLPQKTGGTPHVVIPRLILLGRRARPPQLQRRRAIPFISPAYEHQPRMSLVSPTYAKQGECTPHAKMSARRHF